MKIVSRAECGREAWDGVVTSSPDGWVWALWNWQDLILAVPRWQLAEASFAVVNDSRVIAAVPLQWSGDRRVLACSGWGLTSPALARELSEQERRATLDVVFAEIDRLARLGSAHRIDMALSPVCSTALGVRDQNPFTTFGFAGTTGVVRALDLSRSDEELLADCSRDTRQQLRKARDAGVTSRTVAWPEWLDDYYRLHSETYERTGEQPHPREYFSGIADALAPQGHSVLSAAFDRDGRVLAFHNTARLAGGAMYHTGCSTAAALDCGANYVVLWSAVLSAKAAGARWYEVGEVFPSVTSGKQRGLTTFKSKFGGQTLWIHRATRAIEPEPAAPGRFGKLLRWRSKS